jgi:hypothetical protein
MVQPPKVFVSHASEDKERFVTRFARQLRDNGVDAWVDKWEMLPGDSLVDRIFEEGIKQADAIVVVLSANSVDKPWVKEELNASIIQRIERKAKIIPVVLDDCDVPEALKSTVWQKIPNLDQYESELARILASIHGIDRKPEIGSPPKYTQLSVSRLPSLSEIDTLILTAICEVVLDKGNEWVNTRDLSEFIEENEIPEDDLNDSLAVLDNSYFIEGTPEISGRINFFKLTVHGFETYAQYNLARYDDIVKDVLITVVNGSATSNEELAEEIGEPKILIDFALDTLERMRYLKLAKAMGGHTTAHSVTVEGRRRARELSD